MSTAARAAPGFRVSADTNSAISPSRLRGFGTSSCFSTVRLAPGDPVGTAIGAASSTAGGIGLRMLIEGPPGAGKGTLSKRAAAAFNLVTIASGDLLRQEIEARTPVGHDVAALMAAGALVPDTVVADLILARLADMADAHWMLDGFPRTVAQSRMLDAYLAQIRQPLDLVINLVVPESIILARIMDRWIHPASGRTYNLNFNPPARPGVDDVTGEPLVKRPDDNVDAFRQRLEVYHRHAEPLLEHYRERGVLRTIRGNTSAELFPKLLMLLEEARVQRGIPDTLSAMPVVEAAVQG